MQHLVNSDQNALVRICRMATEQNCYEKALNKASFQYQLRPYNVLNLQPHKIIQTYKNICKKFYSANQNANVQIWFQNQLRIFVWVVIVFAFMENKNIEEFVISLIIQDVQHWDLLSSIFNNKNPLALEFQALCLTRKVKFSKWHSEETQALSEIIRARDEKNRWNEIAKSLFIESDKKYFRTPKQCREHWINHLDPTKSRCEWTSEQDYDLIRAILKNGKKWSRVAKEIGNHRTEHMVKNRYKSMLNNEAKRDQWQRPQNLLVASLLQKMQSASCIQKHLSQRDSSHETQPEQSAPPKQQTPLPNETTQGNAQPYSLSHSPVRSITNEPVDIESIFIGGEGVQDQGPSSGQQMRQQGSIWGIMSEMDGERELDLCQLLFPGLQGEEGANYFSF